MQLKKNPCIRAISSIKLSDFNFFIDQWYRRHTKAIFKFVKTIGATWKGFPPKHWKLPYFHLSMVTLKYCRPFQNHLNSPSFVCGNKRNNSPFKEKCRLCLIWSNYLYIQLYKTDKVLGPGDVFTTNLLTFAMVSICSREIVKTPSLWQTKLLIFDSWKHAARHIATPDKENNSNFSFLSNFFVNRMERAQLWWKRILLA